MIAMATFAASAGSPVAPAPEIGSPAPGFTLTDVTGVSHTLGDFKGKIVVLEWTNTNCPFVQRLYREGIMTAAQKEFVQKGVVWLVINSTNPAHRDYLSPEALKERFAEWMAGFSALLMDTSGAVGKQYDAKTTPHMYIIDKGGVLVYNGAIDDDPRGEKDAKVNYVREALNALLAGRAVSTSVTKPYGCSVKY